MRDAGLRILSLLLRMVVATIVVNQGGGRGSCSGGHVKVGNGGGSWARTAGDVVIPGPVVVARAAREVVLRAAGNFSQTLNLRVKGRKA